MRVANEANLGTAKVTFSFPKWKEGRVRPTTIELPVVDPEPKKEPEKK